MCKIYEIIPQKEVSCENSTNIYKKWKQTVYFFQYFIRNDWNWFLLVIFRKMLKQWTIHWLPYGVAAVLVDWVCRWAKIKSCADVIVALWINHLWQKTAIQVHVHVQVLPLLLFKNNFKHFSIQTRLSGFWSFCVNELTWPNFTEPHSHFLKPKKETSPALCSFFNYNCTQESFWDGIDLKKI